MEWKPQMWPTFAAEVLAARASLRLGDEIGLALRADRQRLGLSQRAYAAHRGWTLGTVIRLETAADAMKLGDVVDALVGHALPAVPVPPSPGPRARCRRAATTRPAPHGAASPPPAPRSAVGPRRRPAP